MDMVAYLHLLMGIIGIAFLIVLVMIFDAVFNEIETGPNAQRIYEFPEKSASRKVPQARGAGAA